MAADKCKNGYTKETFLNSSTDDELKKYNTCENFEYDSSTGMISCNLFSDMKEGE
jgi:hypothetical protein